MDIAQMDCGGMLLLTAWVHNPPDLYPKIFLHLFFDGLSLSAANQSTWLKLIRSPPFIRIKNEIRFLWPDILPMKLSDPWLWFPVIHDIQIIACLLCIS
jgi:hypothetical protein